MKVPGTCTSLLRLDMMGIRPRIAMSHRASARTLLLTGCLLALVEVARPYELRLSPQRSSSATST